MPFALIGFFLGIKYITELPGVKVYMFSQLTVFEKTNLYFYHRWWIFILVILCMVFARSAAMAFNRYLDAQYDAKNPRTAVREIPAGIIKPGNALFFVIANCVLFIVCTFFINSLCFYLSPVALFVVLFYSYTKRFTAFCHLVIGARLNPTPNT